MSALLEHGMDVDTEQVIPIFYSINPASRIKQEFLSKDNIEEESVRNRIFKCSIALMIVQESYLASYVIETKDKDIPPIANLQLFDLREKKELTQFIYFPKKILESPDWHILWFPGKKMDKVHYNTIRDIWIKNLNL